MFRDRLPENQLQRAQRILEDRMVQIFRHLPMLNGFCVGHDLSITELSLHTWPGLDRSQAVAQELGQVLEALIEERPDVLERLRGRTFARSFQ